MSIMSNISSLCSPSSSPIFTALVHLLSPLTLTLGTYTFYKLVKFIWREWISNPLNDFPGPKSPSWLYGNMRQIWEAENSLLHEQWVKEHGSTIKYMAFLGTSRFFTMDLKATNHILMNSHIYQKPDQTKWFLSRLLGDGLLVVEGDKHRAQRKIMNPAFGVSQIRELAEVFVDKALELRDVWAADIKKATTPSEGVPQARINVLSGLSKMALDIIGIAGFNYKFNSLQGERSELNEAFNIMFHSGSRTTMLTVLRGLLGRLRFLLPTEADRATRNARATMDRIGKQLLTDSKSALETAAATGEKDERFRRKDLLSLLLKANMSTDVPEEQRMTDEDVLAQVPTFIIAGHETTSSAAAWVLFSLSLDPTIQAKLREELFTIQTDNPTMDELNSLPYLDAVVRETLRIHAPVPSTLRVAVEDDILPLEKPFVDTKGKVRDSILVRKGQTFYMPLLAINRSPELWGQDAHEFRPERWESVSETTNTIPGVWGNLLTFIGGPRACIGFRLSLAELKVLLFTLIRAFEFKLAVPPEDIGKKSSIALRPFLISDPKAGNQMPLFVSPYMRVD